MSNLVGCSGQVLGIEFEPKLASRAQANLARFPGVEVIHGDGTAMPLGPADHGFTGITRHSRTRVVLTAYFVLSPVIGLACHRRQRIRLCLRPVGPTCLH
jgi:hypothetical protein